MKNAKIHRHFSFNLWSQSSHSLLCRNPQLPSSVGKTLHPPRWNECRWMHWTWSSHGRGTLEPQKQSYWDLPITNKSQLALRSRRILSFAVDYFGCFSVVLFHSSFMKKPFFCNKLNLKSKLNLIWHKNIMRSISIFRKDQTWNNH